MDADVALHCLGDRVGSGQCFGLGRNGRRSIAKAVLGFSNVKLAIAKAVFEIAKAILAIAKAVLGFLNVELAIAKAVFEIAKAILAIAKAVLGFLNVELAIAKAVFEIAKAVLGFSNVELAVSIAKKLHELTVNIQSCPEAGSLNSN